MIPFDLTKSIAILERTPRVLEGMLAGLTDEWVKNNEGEGTWSPYDVIGHLIHGEKTDWIPRMDIILSDRAEKKFEAFDRYAQFSESKGKTTGQLLDEFSELRGWNLKRLRLISITRDILERSGVHPAFGKVTLQQLLAAWVVHDLSHIAQIARVMAKQYREEVGPWREYLGILNG